MWFVICGVIFIAVMVASLYPERPPHESFTVERREPTLDPASWTSIDTGPAGPALSPRPPRAGAD